MVAHWTVIALYVSGANYVEPFQFWSQLGMPPYMVLSAPHMELLDTVESIE